MGPRTNEEIIKAIQQMRGLIFLAAKLLKCSPQTIYNRAKNSPAVREAIDVARGENLDVCESKLLNAIDDAQPWAVSFMLKTQGKDRGYVERQEVTGQGGGPVTLQIIEEVVEADGNAPAENAAASSPEEVPPL